MMAWAAWTWPSLVGFSQHLCRLSLVFSIGIFNHFQILRTGLYSPSQFDLHIFGKAKSLCIHVGKRNRLSSGVCFLMILEPPRLARSGSTCLPHSEPCESWKATGETEPKTIACLESWECRHARRCYLTTSMVDDSCFLVCYLSLQFTPSIYYLFLHYTTFEHVLGKVWARVPIAVLVWNGSVDILFEHIVCWTWHGRLDVPWFAGDFLF